jgi:predicted enzyme related to lactoylglutathione lyase
MKTRTLAQFALLVRDHERLVAHGVRIVRGPVAEPYGTVAVCEDLYGNRRDLVERR